MVALFTLCAGPIGVGVNIGSGSDSPLEHMQSTHQFVVASTIGAVNEVAESTYGILTGVGLRSMNPSVDIVQDEPNYSKMLNQYLHVPPPGSISPRARVAADGDIYVSLTTSYRSVSCNSANLDFHSSWHSCRDGVMAMV